MRRSPLKPPSGAFLFGHFFSRTLLVATVISLGLVGLNLALIYRPAHAAPFNVSLTSDTLPNGVPGELRFAINQVNASSGLQTIDFAIPAAGVQTIALAAPLPSISTPVTIDGTTQPGATCGPAFNLLIQITAGGTFGAAGDGFTFVAGSNGSTINGLVLNGFPVNGISLSNSGGNTVTCSFLGTDATGTVAVPNGGRGIVIDNASQNNLIGGTTATARNILSGNTG